MSCPGSYVGIGVRIDTATDGLPVIDGVFKGSPAEKAGLKAGDELTEVDGKPTTGHDLDEVAGWVRGEAGTTVKVEIRSGPKGTEREFSIVRAAVAEVVVSWTMVPGHEDRVPAARPVLERRRRRRQGRARRDQGCRRGRG